MTGFTCLKLHCVRDAEGRDITGLQALTALQALGVSGRFNSGAPRGITTPQQLACQMVAGGDARCGICSTSRCSCYFRFNVRVVDPSSLVLHIGSWKRTSSTQFCQAEVFRSTLQAAVLHIAS